MSLLPQFRLTSFLASFYPLLDVAAASSVELDPSKHSYQPVVAGNPVQFRFVLASLGVEILALALPAPRWLQQGVAFPACLYLDWILLHCGSPSVTVSYCIGTAIAYHVFQMLDVFFWSDPAKDLVRYEPNALAEGKKEGVPLPKTFSDRFWWVWSLVGAMRHIGWNTQADDELKDPPQRLEPKRFIRDRIMRLVVHYISLDFLVYYVRHMDGEYFQARYEPGSSIGKTLPNPGFPKFYPSNIPSGTLTSFLLHRLAYFQRITLQALAIFNVISALYYVVAIIFVGTPLLFRRPGKRGYWTHPISWPPVFAPFSLTDGLIGFWGKEWHALFRRVYTAPSAYFQLGPTARGIIAFTISGALHYLGAWTNSRRGSARVLSSSCRPSASHSKRWPDVSSRHRESRQRPLGPFG